ncbi:hypothetical protein [Streptomyces canus]|uniref:hypothetical protein n=1 Tax=Streptomyces canus TaxID=58343 RepID=UPI0036E07FE7
MEPMLRRPRTPPGSPAHGMAAARPGDFGSLADRARRPRGARAPPVPILLAGMAPQARRVCGELADGILPLPAGPRALAEHIVPAVTADVGAVRQTAAEARASWEQFPSHRRALGLPGVIRAWQLLGEPADG